MTSQVSPNGSCSFFYLQFPPLRQRVRQEVTEQVGIRVLCQFQQVGQVKLEMTRKLQQKLKQEFTIRFYGFIMKLLGT